MAGLTETAAHDLDTLQALQNDTLTPDAAQLLPLLLAALPQGVEGAMRESW
jgi:hypothetical protein